MFEKTAGHGFPIPVAAHQNVSGPGQLLRQVISSTLWSVRFTRACAQELRLNENQGQFHKLIEEDCLERIFQRAGSFR